MMTQAISKPLTCEEFLEWYPEDGRRYELLDGEIVEMRPVGQHELIASFIDAELTLEIRRRQLSYFSSRNTLVKPNRPGSTDSVYQLVDGEYQVSQFRGTAQVISPTFPELALTAAQVFAA